MTEEVLITISGLHVMSETGGDDEVEMIYPGKYRKVGETRCLRYTEVTEECRSENLIKLRPGSLELVKTGDMATNMLIEIGKKTFTEYQTVFGSMELGICASEVQLSESQDCLEARAEYSLEANGSFLSECTIRIMVQPRKEMRAEVQEAASC